jgi:hypothetical protein
MVATSIFLALSNIKCNMNFYLIKQIGYCYDELCWQAIYCTEYLLMQQENYHGVEFIVTLVFATISLCYKNCYCHGILQLNNVHCDHHFSMG